MVEPQGADAARKVEQGTAEALCRQWYHAYGQSLYSYVRVQVPSADLAEDLTAEVFLRALRAVARFDSDRGSPKAWLFRIAQNVVRDHQRQAKRRTMLPLAAFRDLECQAPSPEERLLWEEEVARLLSALTELPPRDREVIGLCYSSALSVAETAEVLGLSETAVRTRLWRALARLRKVFSR